MKQITPRITKYGMTSLTRGYVVFRLTVCALLLGGCAVTPQSITPREALKSSQADRANLFSGQQPVSAEISLEEAIARALKYNRERRVQLLESVISRTQLKLAHYDMLPHLAASAGYTQRSNLAASSSGTYENGTITRTTPPTYSVSADKESSQQNLALTWNVLDFGLSYVRAEQQADRVLIAQERERKAVHNLMQDVRSAYWRAVSAQRLLDKVGPLHKRVEMALSDSRQIENLRLKNPLEALTYQRELLDIRRSLEGLQKDLVDAKTSLATLMGLPAGAEFKLQDIGDAGYEVLDVQLDVETLERTALARRPELAESRYQSRITHAEGRAALLALLPGINLNVGTHYDGSDYLMNNRWNDYGATLSFNLFNIFKAPAVMRQVDSQKVLAQERHLALIAAVIGQVHVARMGYAQARQQFTTATEYLSVSKRIRDQMRLMRGVERTGELDLIREELSEMLSELRRDVAYAELQNSYGRIFVSAGLDPLPETLADDSLQGLATAIRSKLESWKGGEVGLVTSPLSQQIKPWSGPGEHRFVVSAETFSLGGKTVYRVRQVDGQPLPEWLKFDPESQTFSANPPVAKPEYQIEVAATNSSGAKASDRFTLKLIEVNDAPLAQGSEQHQCSEGGAPLLGRLRALDPDGDTLRFSLSGGQSVPAGFTIDSDGNWRFDPAHPSYEHLKEGGRQSLSIQIEAQDPHGGKGTIALKIIVTGRNNAPVFVGVVEAKLSAADQPINGKIGARDPDDDAVVTFDALSEKLPAGFSLSRDGAWRFDPRQAEYSTLKPGDFRVLIIPVKAKDGLGEEVMGRIQIAILGVNNAPRLTNMANPVLQLSPDNSYRAAFSDDLFVDPEAQPLRYNLTQRGFFGDTPLPAWLQFDANIRTLSLQADGEAARKSASIELILTAADSEGKVATRPLLLQVLPQTKPVLVPVVEAAPVQKLPPQPEAVVVPAPEPQIVASPPVVVDPVPLVEPVPVVKVEPKIEVVPVVEVAPVQKLSPQPEAVVVPVPEPQIVASPPVVVAPVPLVEPVPVVKVEPTIEVTPVVQSVPKIEPVPVIEVASKVEAVAAVEVAPVLKVEPTIEVVPVVEATPEAVSQEPILRQWLLKQWLLEQQRLEQKRLNQKKLKQ